VNSAGSESSTSVRVRLVDSHCHLDDEKFDGDRDAAIERARAAGVERMMVIGTGDGPPDLEAGIRLADRYPFIYATVGVHPHEATKATPETIDGLAELVCHPKVLAVGEIGLDYHYDFSPRDVQRRIFAEQLELAARAQKPIVIHTREAWEDTLALVREHGLPFGGIMHCFTGGPGEAEQALERGFHLSFGGIVTFPKAQEVRDAAAITPEDRLLVETDAPYLAPVPYRGKRNEPAFMVETARKLAEIRGETVAHLAWTTTRNFERLCMKAG
jgi:TatD DNase family protein